VDAANTPPAAPTPKAKDLGAGWARFLSVLFHPLLVPSELGAILITFSPEGWTSLALRAWVAVVLGTALAPALTALILARMGWVSAFHLPLRTDRQWPMAVGAAGMYWAFKQAVRWGQPDVLSLSLLAACVTLVLLYGALLWIKASGHTAGLAGASVSVAFASLQWGWTPLPLLGALALLAAVAAARIRIRAHTPQEIAWGLVFGGLPLCIFLALRP
jgi:hypothetical protein